VEVGAVPNDSPAITPVTSPLKLASRKQSASSLIGALSSLRSEDNDDDGINDLFQVEGLDVTAPTGDASATRPAVFQRIEPLREPFIGAWMGADVALRGLETEELLQRQQLVQVLYETRIAALQRYVGFLVLFHEMGKRVAAFWPSASCGLLGYDMSRTHSIMRIATTASPVSGSEVRHKTLELASQTATNWAHTILQLLAARWYVQEPETRATSPSADKLDRMRRILYTTSSAVAKSCTASPAISPVSVRPPRSHPQHPADISVRPPAPRGCDPRSE